MFVVSCSAPSAVWASDTPSLVLRTAWFRPRTCAVNRLVIASPAASSRALLMRRPEDSRWNDRPKASVEPCRFRCVFSAATFVLMKRPIVLHSLKFSGDVALSPNAVHGTAGCLAPAGTSGVGPRPSPNGSRR